MPGDNKSQRKILPNALCMSNVPKARPYMVALILPFSYGLNGALAEADNVEFAPSQCPRLRGRSMVRSYLSIRSLPRAASPEGMNYKAPRIHSWGAFLSP